jgi:glutaconate CoA-transferase, subunit B
VVVRHRPRTLVERLEFITSLGFGDGPGHRAALGLRGRGPVQLITDLGVLEPDPETYELTLTHIHPGVAVDQVRAATGWPLAVRDELSVTEPPTAGELAALRSLTTRSSTKGGGNGAA